MIGDDLLTVAWVEGNDAARHNEIGDAFAKYRRGEITGAEWTRFQDAVGYAEDASRRQKDVALERINNGGKLRTLRQRLGGFVRRHL